MIYIRSTLIHTYQLIKVQKPQFTHAARFITSQLGRSASKRLLFILRHCPTLSPAAFTLIQKQLTSGRDTTLFEKAINVYSARVKGSVPPANFKQWVETTNKKNDNEKNKLEVELKTYTSNMIKESIRVCVYRIWLSNFSDLH